MPRGLDSHIGSTAFGVSSESRALRVESKGRREVAPIETDHRGESWSFEGVAYRVVAPDRTQPRCSRVTRVPTSVSSNETSTSVVSVASKFLVSVALPLIHESAL